MQKVNSSKRSILIVDDETVVRINLADFFEDEGCSVFEAEDIGAAIAILNANPSIRIVLTDLGIPGSIDGKYSPIMFATSFRRRCW